MLKLSVREIRAMSANDLENIPVKHIVVFDDGEEIEAYRNETRYSTLFWVLFDKYPTTRILKHHHYAGVMRGECLNSKTHNVLCTNIFKSIVIEQGLFLPEQKEPLLSDVYMAISDAQNALIHLTERDVISLDILDMVQISNHPEILALKHEAMADPKKIKYAYEQGLKLIVEHPDFEENNLAKAVRAKMVKMNQVVQCVMFIGYPSEVDGTIFDKPIWSNYTTGVNEFYELVSDSRKAAKSYIYSDSALKDSEYNARKFQLYAMVLEKIAYQDCGSTSLMPWRVKPKVRDASGVVTYSGDLPRLVGKHYKRDKNEPWSVITGKEKDLEGTFIWIRTILGCQHSNPHEACHLCAGDISQNISRFDNVGHLGTVTTTKPLSQMILSFKHVNTSSQMSTIEMADYERQYLHAGKENDGYYVKPQAKGKRVSVTVVRDEAPGLIDLTSIDDIKHVSLPRMSSISSIRLNIADISGYTEENLLKTKSKQSAAMLSRDLLNYLSEHGWMVDADNNFVFDLDKWDYDKPILSVQNKEESVADLVKQVEQMVQSNQQLHKKRLSTENAPQVLLQELFDLVNSKFEINFFCFEVIVYGLMVSANNSMALARNAESPVLGISEALTIHRSLGSAMAFENHKDALFSPAYFYGGSRPDNIMDVFLKPQEVIESRYGPQS